MGLISPCCQGAASSRGWPITSIFHKTAGVLFFLLALTAFLFRGTSDYSILLISYSIMLAVLGFSFALQWSAKSVQYDALMCWMLLWLAWTTFPPLLGWVSDTALFGIFQCTAWVFTFF